MVNFLQIEVFNGPGKTVYRILVAHNLHLIRQSFLHQVTRTEVLLGDEKAFFELCRVQWDSLQPVDSVQLRYVELFSVSLQLQCLETMTGVADQIFDIDARLTIACKATSVAVSEGL